MGIKCPKCQHDNPDDTLYCGKCGVPIEHPEDISVTKTLETPVEQLVQGCTFATRYEIIEELGRGGMGRVYRVHDAEIAEEVALKLLKAEIASDENTIERFRNELKIARKVSHKNVCRMYDIGRESDKYFITMEYVAGENLKSLIREKGNLSTEEAIGIAQQVCEGLAEAHRLGVIHRDLKPQNIMIDHEGQAKIMDFGIARSVEAPGVTQTGVIIGTPDYISPEQAEGEKADQRSDIYSLGVILYEMVTGSVPFKGDTAFSVALKHKTQLPQDPRKFNSQLSDDLARLILVCMEKEKERRYQKATDLLADLRNIEEGFPLGTKIRPKRKTLAATIARQKAFIPALVTVIAIVAVLLWRLLPRGEPITVPKIENSIAVISFQNQTGDRSFDYLQEAIPNLLITGLEQAGVYVVSWERLGDLLKQLGRPEAQTIDKELGFRLCRMEGVESIVLGSFVKAENTFVTDVKVLDVESKAILKSTSARGEGVASIFPQIDELCLSVAEGLGLAKQKMDLEKLRVSGVTTDSMEAYRAYLEGMENWRKYYLQEAAENFEKAVAIDPQFATAYLQLGMVYLFLGVSDPTKAIEKAKQYASRATEKERLYIEAHYAYFIENNPEKFIDTFQVLIQKYPKEKLSYFSLGSYYLFLGKYQESVEMLEKALALDPEYGDAHNSIAYAYSDLKEYDQAIRHMKKNIPPNPGEPNPLDSLGDVYLAAGKLDDAQAYYSKAVTLKPDFYVTYRKLAYVYAMKEDYPKALDLLDGRLAEASAPTYKLDYHQWKGFYSFWLGRIDLCLSHLQKANEIAAANGLPTFAEDALRSLYYYKIGKLDVSREAIDAWFSEASKSPMSPEDQKSMEASYRWMLAMIDVRERNIQSAKTRLVEIQSFKSSLYITTPAEKEWWQYYADLLEAEILLLEKKYDQALAIIDKAPLPPSSSDWTWKWRLIIQNNLLRNDLKARILEEKGDLDRAISEYERLTKFDPKSDDHNLLINPKFYYRLAGLYERKGLKAKARDTFQKFLTLWKDADPEIAEVEDARKRLAGLKGQ